MIYRKLSLQPFYRHQMTDNRWRFWYVGPNGYYSFWKESSISDGNKMDSEMYYWLEELKPRFLQSAYKIIYPKAKNVLEANPGKIIFQRKSDALMFKMVWGGQ